MRPERNCHQFADDICKHNFVNVNYASSPKFIEIRFCPMNNKYALDKEMVKRGTGGKPFTDAYF